MSVKPFRLIEFICENPSCSLGGETKDDKGMIMGLRDIWSFSMTTRRWTKLQCNIPEDFPFFASAAIVDDIIYLYRSTWFGALQLSSTS
jgi:hypothetical protein